MRIDDPFHKGELQVQERAGELEEGRRNGRVLADSIMPGALKFVAQQPMVVLGSVDERQDVWASMLFGPPGFVTAADERRVEFDLSRAGISEHDPFWKNIQHNPRIGALFLELATRRRLRINGTVAHPTSDRLALDVAECYPNCPKYIQRRNVQFEAVERSETVPSTIDGHSLNREQAALIQASDTFFVASAHPRRGVDASHRGGPPGFVEVVDERTLRIPDYVGNSMFNTLGNFTVNPRAGLVFLDFKRNRTLQLTGCAEILWDQEDTSGRTGGTQRFWIFKVDRWRESKSHAGLRWEFLDYSPHNPQPAEHAAPELHAPGKTRRAAQRKRRWFYVWVVPLLWSTVCLTAFKFPGDEYAMWAVGSIAGCWVFAFMGNSGAVSSVLPWVVLAGAVTMAVIGLLLDLVRARRRVWLALLAVAATAICVRSIGSYPSYARAIAKNGSLAAYALFGINFGLYVSCLIMLPVYGARRLWQRPIPPNNCRKCGYNLTGNESGVCPECGERA